MTHPSPRQALSRLPLLLAALGEILPGLGCGGGAAVSAPPPGSVGEERRALGEPLARCDLADPTAPGKAAAPVVLVAHFDHRCPCCGSSRTMSAEDVDVLRALLADAFREEET